MAHFVPTDCFTLQLLVPDDVVHLAAEAITSALTYHPANGPLGWRASKPVAELLSSPI